MGLPRPPHVAREDRKHVKLRVVPHPKPGMEGIAEWYDVRTGQTLGSDAPVAVHLETMPFIAQRPRAGDRLPPHLEVLDDNGVPVESYDARTGKAIGRTFNAEFTFPDGETVLATAQFVSVDGGALVKWTGDTTRIQHAVPGGTPTESYAGLFETTMNLAAQRAGAEVKVTAEGQWFAFEK